MFVELFKLHFLTQVDLRHQNSEFLSFDELVLINFLILLGLQVVIVLHLHSIMTPLVLQILLLPDLFLLILKHLVRVIATPLELILELNLRLLFLEGHLVDHSLSHFFTTLLVFDFFLLDVLLRMELLLRKSGLVLVLDLEPLAFFHVVQCVPK